MLSLILTAFIQVPVHADVASELKLCLRQARDGEEDRLMCYADGAKKLVPVIEKRLGGAFNQWRRRTEDLCEVEAHAAGGARLHQHLAGVRCFYLESLRQLEE